MSTDDSEPVHTPDHDLPLPVPGVETSRIRVTQYIHDPYIQRYEYTFVLDEGDVAFYTRAAIEHSGERTYRGTKPWPEVPDAVKRELGERLGVDDLDAHLDLPESLRGEQR